MRYALLLLVLLAYPLTMVDPPGCMGGGCASYRDGTCVNPGDYHCGTTNHPGACTTVDGNKPGTHRCVCVPVDSPTGPVK